MSSTVVVSVAISRPVDTKVFQPKVKVTSADVRDLYEKGLQKYNALSGASITMEDCQFNPEPDKIGTGAYIWEQAAKFCPIFSAVLLHPGQQKVDEAYNKDLQAAATAEQQKLDDKVRTAVEEALEKVREQHKLDMETALKPLSDRVQVLEKQMALCAPLLIRKIVYKARQVLINQVSGDGVAATIKDFTAWASQQDEARLLQCLSAVELDCVRNWGTTNGDLVAHYEFDNEEPVLAAAVEALEYNDVKTVLQGVYLFAFGMSSGTAAAQVSRPVDTTTPGRSVMGPDRAASRPRSPTPAVAGGRVGSTLSVGAADVSVSAPAVPTPAVDATQNPREKARINWMFFLRKNK